MVEQLCQFLKWQSPAFEQCPGFQGFFLAAWCSAPPNLLGKPLFANSPRSQLDLSTTRALGLHENPLFQQPLHKAVMVQNDSKHLQFIWQGTL